MNNNNSNVNISSLTKTNEIESVGINLDISKSSTETIEDINSLSLQEKDLDSKIEDLQKKNMDRLQIMDALHYYNDLKDAAQIVLGRLACLEGTTVAHIHHQFGISDND